MNGGSFKVGDGKLNVKLKLRYLHADRGANSTSQLPRRDTNASTIDCKLAGTSETVVQLVGQFSVSKALGNMLPPIWKLQVPDNLHKGKRDVCMSLGL